MLPFNAVVLQRDITQKAKGCIGEQMKIFLSLSSFIKTLLLKEACVYVYMKRLSVWKGSQLKGKNNASKCLF